jgi:hypothetical protein
MVVIFFSQRMSINHDFEGEALVPESHFLGNGVEGIQLLRENNSTIFY